MANKLVIMSIYRLGATHNWESVMNLNNRMLNIDKKTIKKNKKRKKKTDKKNIFFIKKTFFIEIKNPKIKNVFFLQHYLYLHYILNY